MSVKDEEKVYNELMQNAPTAEQSASTLKSAAALQNAEQTGTMPTAYTGSTADEKLDEAINKWLSSRGFNYNTANDKDYQTYVQQFKQNATKGRELSKQTATQLANGYNPTYADTVASEVYNQQLENVTNAIPTFKSLAEQQYNAEQTRQGNIANLYATQAQTDYSRYRNTVADNKNYLEYLYNRYATDRQSDVEQNANKASIYGSQLSATQNNLSEARSYNNQNYLYNTQSAESRANIAEQEYENNQKIAYDKAKAEYDAEQERLAEEQAAREAEQKAEQKLIDEENERRYKRNGSKYIEAYNLKDANYEYQTTQLAIGYYKGYISLGEMDYIADELNINTSDIEAKLNTIEKNGGSVERRYGSGKYV